MKSQTEIEQPKSPREWVEIIRGLTTLQQDALSRLCCNDDSCLNPNTAKALAKCGLIDYELVDDLYRARVASLAVYYAWCLWCRRYGGGKVRLVNKRSGDVLEILPPDSLGHSFVTLNGIQIESVFYGDASITLGDGRTFASDDELAAYLTGRLRGTEEVPRG